MASISMLGADKSVAEMEAEIRELQRGVAAWENINFAARDGSLTDLEAAQAQAEREERYATTGVRFRYSPEIAYDRRRELDKVDPLSYTRVAAPGSKSGVSGKSDSWIVPAAIAGAALLLGVGFLSVKG